MYSLRTRLVDFNVTLGPLCACSIIACAFAIKLPKQDHSHWREKIVKIDFLGAFILLVAVFGLLIGLDSGSNVSWNSPVAIAGLCTAPLFIVFVLVEKHVATHPFAPLRIILNRSLFANYLCNFCGGASFLSILFFSPLYWQVVYDYKASQAGTLLAPSIIGGVTGSVIGGQYMKRTGKYFWITVTSYTILIGGVLLTLLSTGILFKNLPLMVVGTAICAFTNGLAITTTLIGLIANAAPEDQAVTTACSYLFRSLGSVFGVSMSATAFNQTLRKSLSAALKDGEDAEELAKRVRAGLSYFRSLEPHLKEIVRTCYADASRAAFGVAVLLAVSSAVFAWFIREKKLT